MTQDSKRDLPPQVTLSDDLLPLDEEGQIIPHHLDGGGTTHWFAVVDNTEPEAEPYELRYFRAARADGGHVLHDSYPVMPLPDDDPGSAWPLPDLEKYLAAGDVYMAQQLARDIADNCGQEFPDPPDLPALNPQPEYYFGYGVGPNNEPSLEAVKTWMYGSERRFDTLTIAEYGMYEEARIDERELNQLRETQGLEAAMNLAERMAVTGGYLDPIRDDPRLFVEDGPADPFTTVREREIPDYGIGAISANGESFIEVVKSWGDGEYERLTIPQPSWEEAHLQATMAFALQANGDLQGAMNLVELAGIEAGVVDPQHDDPRLFTQGPPDPFTTNLERERAEAAIIREHQDDNAQILAPEARAEQFRKQFADSNYHLLEPVDPTVNYSFEVVAVDPWTLELAADKWWLEEDRHIGNQTQTLKTYPMESYEWEREAEREIAEMDREDLYRTYQEEGLEVAMRQAEGMAVANDELDADRTDGRLFRQGPPDRFTTAREVELLGLESVSVDESIRDITNDETQEMPAVLTPEPDSWEALIAAQTGDEPEPERHYWQMHYRPVETPEGERLGTALFVTDFPQLPPDFDDYVAENGIDDSVYPTEARTLEMAHFANEEEARKFDAEFRSYLVPDLLDGPELAPEVAKLEGLSGEWEDMNYNQIVDYMSGDRKIVREESEWHLHNPNAERDAHITAEGLYADLGQRSIATNMNEQASPDMEL